VSLAARQEGAPRLSCSHFIAYGAVGNQLPADLPEDRLQNRENGENENKYHKHKPAVAWISGLVRPAVKELSTCYENAAGLRIMSCFARKTPVFTC